MKKHMKSLCIALILCLAMASPAAAGAEGAAETDIVSHATRQMDNGGRTRESESMNRSDCSEDTPAQPAEKAPGRRRKKSGGQAAPRPSSRKAGAHGVRGKHSAAQDAPVPASGSGCSETFDALQADGVISAETCERVKEYLASITPASQEEMLSVLLNGEVISQAEYDAITAAFEEALPSEKGAPA